MLQTNQSSAFGGGGRNSWRCLAAGFLLLAACTSTPQGREAKYMEKGKSAAARKNYHAAIVDFEVASQNMPRDAEPVYQLGMAYLGMGWAARAVDAASIGH